MRSYVVEGEGGLDAACGCPCHFCLCVHTVLMHPLGCCCCSFTQDAQGARPASGSTAQRGGRGGHHGRGGGRGGARKTSAGSERPAARASGTPAGSVTAPPVSTRATRGNPLPAGATAAALATAAPGMVRVWNLRERGETLRPWRRFLYVWLNFLWVDWPLPATP